MRFDRQFAGMAFPYAFDGRGCKSDEKELPEFVVPVDLSEHFISAFAMRSHRCDFALRTRGAHHGGEFATKTRAELGAPPSDAAFIASPIGGIGRVVLREG